MKSSISMRIDEPSVQPKTDTIFIDLNFYMSLFINTNSTNYKTKKTKKKCSPSTVHIVDSYWQYFVKMRYVFECSYHNVITLCCFPFKIQMYNNTQLIWSIWFRSVPTVSILIIQIKYPKWTRVQPIDNFNYMHFSLSIRNSHVLHLTWNSLQRIFSGGMHFSDNKWILDIDLVLKSLCHW